MNKSFLIGIAITLALILGGIGAFKHDSSYQAQIVGGTSPDFASPYISWGGVVRYTQSRTNLIQASSTFCDLISPSATSTLSQGWIQLSLASTAAVTLDIGQSANQTATTTKLIGTQAIAANATALILASTTANGAAGPGGDAKIFGPNTHLVFKVGGNGDNTGWAPTGDCGADWIVN